MNQYSRVCFAATTLACLLTLNTRANPPVASPELLPDAELTDVFFLDPEQGFAVGDRGVIWMTVDGGQSWQWTRSPVSCRLESIHFIDSRNGWIVGGHSHPYTHKSTAVILRTRDGGKRWSTISGLLLPALKQVYFSDAKTGWVIGNASAMFPSGIFRTQDGGRSWSAVAGPRSGGWLTGHFGWHDRGIVAGHDGALAKIMAARSEPLRTASVGPRHLRRLDFSDTRRGWLIGDGGLILRTEDAGEHWNSLGEDLPAGIARQLDFRAMATFGEHVWIAGSPGTRVLHSQDGGEHWDIYPTGQAIPLRAITFHDEYRGWAVGSLGTILATRDGGKTWQRQASGGDRAALLGLFGEPNQICWELFASLSGDEGYLGVVELLHRMPIEGAAPNECSWDERAHRGIVAVGASGADFTWRFPVRQRELKLTATQIQDGWNAVNDGQAGDYLLEHLVKKIRQWKPSVVVTEPASPAGANPASHLTNQFVLEAVSRSSDPLFYPDQLTALGLETWEVLKVYCTVPAGEPATLDLNTSQLGPRLGCSFAECASAGQGQIESEYHPAPVRRGFQLLVNQLPGKLGRQGFFSGIPLRVGGSARRELGPIQGDLQQLARAAQRRRNLQQMIDRIDNDPTTGAAWIGQANDLTRGLSRAAAGNILSQLAAGYHRSNRSDLAGEVYELLLQRYPNHPLSEAAAIWLIHYYSSSEVGWRLRRKTRFRVQQAGGTSVALPGSEVRPAGYLELEETQPVQTTSAGTAAIGLKPHERAGRAAAIGRLLERTNPGLFAEPAVRFPLAAAYRVQGLSRDAERYFHALTQPGVDPHWQACGLGELWLKHATGLPPKALLTCSRAQQKPRLDGILNDPIWNATTAAPLSSARHDDHDWPCVVLAAQDREYLYLAISAQKPRFSTNPTNQRARPRDADLSAHDRVEFLIDVDRDFATYFRLAVDHRGWNRESCFGDLTWNPRWFVAARDGEREWTCEIAIPLHELTPQAPLGQDAWAIGIQRIVPQAGFQSWTQPADIKIQTRGFGLMVFE